MTEVLYVIATVALGFSVVFVIHYIFTEYLILSNIGQALAGLFLFGLIFGVPCYVLGSVVIMAVERIIK